MKGLSYCTCEFVVSRPFTWYHNFWACDLDLEVWPSFEKLEPWLLYKFKWWLPPGERRCLLTECFSADKNTSQNLTIKYPAFLKEGIKTKVVAETITARFYVITWVYLVLFQHFKSFNEKREQRSGVVVIFFKLLACRARGSGFDSQSRRYNFRDLLSPASKSHYGWNTAVRSSEVNPQYNNNNEKHGSLWQIHTCMYKCRSLCNCQYL